MCRREEKDRVRGQVRQCVKVCEQKGGFRCMSLPGSMLDLQSHKLFFYKSPCLPERGQLAQMKRKRVGKSSQGCNRCYAEKRSVHWYCSIQFGLRPVEVIIRPFPQNISPICLQKMNPSLGCLWLFINAPNMTVTSWSTQT